MNGVHRGDNDFVKKTLLKLILAKAEESLKISCTVNNEICS